MTGASWCTQNHHWFDIVAEANPDDRRVKPMPLTGSMGPSWELEDKWGRRVQQSC